MKFGVRIFQAPPTRCTGRDGTCILDAVKGDLCLNCWASLPRCAECGHHVDAHDEGPCAVGNHEGSRGPECECQGFIHPGDDDER